MHSPNWREEHTLQCLKTKSSREYFGPGRQKYRILDNEEICGLRKDKNYDKWKAGNDHSNSANYLFVIKSVINLVRKENHRIVIDVDK